MGPPPNLLKWFSSSYPTLRLDPNWIEPCFEYLTETFPGTTAPKMIKLVETQLLLSDLSTSTLDSDQLIPVDLPQENGQIFPTRATSILTQIMTITEIGQPALGLLSVLKEKGELAKMKIENEGMDEQAVEDGEEEVKEGTFGRGMLKFKLSDGFRTIEAIEWARIDQLRLGETKLGCKLVLQNVKMSKGVLLLGPDCVTVKGHSVEELEVDADALLEASLKFRLGQVDEVKENRPPSPVPPPPPRVALKPKPVLPKPAVAQPKPKPKVQQKLPPLVKLAPVKVEEEYPEEDEEMPDQFDDDEEAAMLEMEREAEMANKKKVVKPVIKKPPIRAKVEPTPAIQTSQTSKEVQRGLKKKSEAQYMEVNSEDDQKPAIDSDSNSKVLAKKLSVKQIVFASGSKKKVAVLEISDDSSDEEAVKRKKKLKGSQEPIVLD